MAAQREQVAAYPYVDETGTLLYEVVRYEPKDFRQRRPDGNGDYIHSLGDVRRVPYRLPELNAHLAANTREPIYIVDGEKDAAAVAAIGATVTCAAGGMEAGWNEDLVEYLTGARSVRIVVDRDEAGERAAQKLAGLLAGVGVGETQLELCQAKLGKDASDHLAAGYSLDDFETITYYAEVIPIAPIAEPEHGFIFDVLTAREICALPDPPLDDVMLGPLAVRRYRTIIAAGSGEGKTTLSLAIIRTLTVGGELLSWTCAGGERVLILDLEQGLRTVKRRLEEVGLEDCDLVDYVRVPDGLALEQDAQQRDALEQLLRDNGYAAVLLDPFYKAHRGESNDERAIIDLMRVLDGWRETYGFALLLPAHTRKRLEPGGKLTIDDIFGSGAFVRGAELVVGLQRVSNGFARIYWFKDRDGSDETVEIGSHWNLLYDRDTGYRRDPQDLAPPRDLVSEIDAWLQEHPNSSTNEVIVGVGAGRTRVSDILKKDDRFTYQPGANKARFWVSRSPEYHLRPPEPPRNLSGVPLGVPSIEGHHEDTETSGVPVSPGHSKELPF